MILRYLQFWFFRKGSGNSFLTTFCVSFFKENVIYCYKCYKKLYIVKWPGFIAWLSLLLEILINIYIEIVCEPGCDVIDFEKILIFLSKELFLLDQKVTTKFQYFENKKSFYREIKRGFHHFSSQKLSHTLLPSYLILPTKTFSSSSSSHVSPCRRNYFFQFRTRQQFFFVKWMLTYKNSSW